MRAPKPTICFIGSGVMAEAMIKGLLSQDTMSAAQLVAADPREERGQELVERYDLRYESDNKIAAAHADILVLSVKPQALAQVLPELHDSLGDDTFVLSIVAGASSKRLADGLGTERIIRAMPNTPAQIGQGITIWLARAAVLESERSWARTLLGALGQEIAVEDESLLDMATALSGSGPAYVFLFMEALIDVGVHMGFSRRIAEQLVQQTLLGSVAFAQASGLHLASLRNQVTSPGGTSAEAIFHLEKGGLRTVIARAVWAAYERSISLGSNGQHFPE